jgi:hypothetical protein
MKEPVFQGISDSATAQIVGLIALRVPEFPATHVKVMLHFAFHFATKCH